MACMCLVLLNIHIFSWRLVLMISLSLKVVMTCTLLRFPVSFWIDIYSKNVCAVVGSFMPIIRIQTLVLFIAVNLWFRGMWFSDWEMYDMLWWSQYCVTITMVVHLGGKFTLASNISYLIKGWSERSIFNIGRVEIFFPSISPEPGDHPLPNLLLGSSKISDEQYLSLLVCGYHHFIVSMIFF